ncbi:adenosylcobinamide-GDP ribazoletransferase [Fodinisporobacter ferrooxydans]|uniref:Adenosylcobinamide-GDP ribazoletransferase n=1 Tax=Fodinisporobacter ferrooxydans TaxID=2901836 RepID=A0ABY4CH22_9BACL|nr:adenosylcobinamide-GDP ribazoletransferase [Alicyclobacillaceae bacterium MYW30-H2]
MMQPFFHALAFLTRIPVPPLSASEGDWQKSAAYYPLVGGILGVLIYAASMLFINRMPMPVGAVLSLSFWVYLTGGLHLDGWMDLADGLGSNRTREQMLAIMKDSRVGAMGVIAGVLVLLVKAAALYELMYHRELGWVIASPVLARAYLLAAIYFYPYLSEKGIASGLKTGLSKSGLAINFVILLLGLAYFFGVKGLLLCLPTFFLSWLFSRSIVKRLQGLTGDCYGAIVEWTEAVSLVVILALGK